MRRLPVDKGCGLASGEALSRIASSVECSVVEDSARCSGGGVAPKVKRVVVSVSQSVIWERRSRRSEGGPCAPYASAGGAKAWTCNHSPVVSRFTLVCATLHSQHTEVPSKTTPRKDMMLLAANAQRRRPLIMAGILSTIPSLTPFWEGQRSRQHRPVHLVYRDQSQLARAGDEIR